MRFTREERAFLEEVTGKTGSLVGLWHTLFDQSGIARGNINTRYRKWLRKQLDGPETASISKMERQLIGRGSKDRKKFYRKRIKAYREAQRIIDQTPRKETKAEERSIFRRIWNRINLFNRG